MNKHLALILVLTTSLTACTKGCNKGGEAEAPSTTATTTTQAPPAAENQAAAPKLEIEDQKVGAGAEAVSGKTITVHYTGTLTNGTKFDSSLDRKEPFTFSLGAGQVIKGWDQGFAGMKVGGKRKLTNPPELAYGPNAVGSIPANSTLVFEVELLDVN